MEKGKIYSAFAVVALCLAAAFGCGGPVSGCISLYVYIWKHQFGVLASQAGWISSILHLFFYVLGPLASLLVNVVGVWKTQLFAALLTSAGLVSTAFSNQAWQIVLAYSMLVGFGCSLSRSVSYAVIKNYFPKRQAQMYAVFYTGYSCGQLIFPVLMDYLIKTVGYQNAVMIQALFLVIILICAALVFWLNDHRKSVIENGDQKPDVNCTEIQQVEVYSVDAKASQIHDSSRELTTSQAIKIEMMAQLHMLKQASFILTLISYVFDAMSASVFYTYIIDSVMHAGYATLSQSTIGQTTMGIALLIGSLLMVALMKFNKQPRLFQTVTVLCAGVFNACLPQVRSVIWYYILCFLSGFNESLLSSNFLRHGETFGMDRIDSRVAFISAASGMGFTLGPIISGYLIKFVGFDHIFYLAGGFSLVAAILTAPSSIKSLMETFRRKVNDPKPTADAALETELAPTENVLNYL